MSRFWIIPLCLTLAGCGGGGSSVSSWLKSEPDSVDKTSLQLAQLGTSDSLPEVPKVQVAANPASVVVPTKAGQSLPAVDMSRSWSSSVEAAPLDDLPPLPNVTPNAQSTLGHVKTEQSYSAESEKFSIASAAKVPGTTTSESATLEQSIKISAAAAPPVAYDPYADRTARYLATSKTKPSISGDNLPVAMESKIPSYIPVSSDSVASIPVHAEALPDVPAAKAPAPKVVKISEKATVSHVNHTAGKQYLVFASFNEPGRAESLARRHTKLGATVLTSEIGGTPVYRVAVPVGKSVAGKRRDLAAVGLTEAWPLRM
ncbi:MAG: hypothetical protein R3E60_01275 [Alphaproteobacteria bacterium]